MSIKKLNTNEEIFSRIRLAYDISKLKQKEFAERIKITPSYLSEVLGGKKIPSAHLLKIISMEFDLDFNWLLSGEGDMSRPHIVREPRAGYNETGYSNDPRMKLIIEEAERAFDGCTNDDEKNELLIKLLQAMKK